MHINLFLLRLDTSMKDPWVSRHIKFHEILMCSNIVNNMCILGMNMFVRT